jgi:hypothetical protein
MKPKYDVAVIGGGTAGVIAAIQAGRAGAKSILIEKGSMLGGTISVAAVDYTGLFHAWGKQIIAGIGWELIQKCVAETGGSYPDFGLIEKAFHTQQIQHDGFVYSMLCDEAITAAGVDLLFHTMPAAVIEKDDGVVVTLCTKTGLQDLHASFVIDCTGDANVAALAGCKTRTPQLNDIQPCTLSCRATGYDLELIDKEALVKASEAAVASGELHSTDCGWNTEKPQILRWLRSRGKNASHIHHMNGRDSEGRSAIEIAGRQSLLRLYRFLRKQPGLERFRFEFVAPETGVRETATVVGKKTVTVDDYTAGRIWDDAVCWTFYNIDLHVSDARGNYGGPLDKGVVPTIPRGALLPAGTKRLAVAGRCLSSDRKANSAMRVEAPCMAMGQAMGANAAIAAAAGLDDLEAVPMEELRQLLRKHGAILPGDN